MEYLVKVSKRHAFWSLNEDILKIIDSDNQYAISIKEDMAYPCLHFTRYHEGFTSNTPYLGTSICRIQDLSYTEILEDIKHGPHSKKPQYAVSKTLDMPLLDEVKLVVDLNFIPRFNDLRETFDTSVGPLECKWIKAYKFNLLYMASIKWVVELPFNAYLNPGFVPLGTFFSSFEEVLGALSGPGFSALQMAKGPEGVDSIDWISKETIVFLSLGDIDVVSLNTLRECFEKVGISRETFVARSPQQNGIVERRNHTQIKAARTMLIYAKAPLFLWAEAVATAYLDELTAMVSEHSSSGPALHEMTPAIISLGLVPNPPHLTPFVPPSRTDWELFVAPEPAVLTDSPFSTTVDQDAPSPSNSQTTPETESPIIPNDVEEENHDSDIAHMNNDLFFGIPIPENDSEASSS
ncbi:retrovirus-related pol polyprotein from transposon TNT 1-94 [Tanacetum coccineum]